MKAIKVLYFVLLLVVYGPLVLHGGFGTADDLTFVAEYNGDFSEELSTSLGRIGHVSRPIYGLAQVLTLEFFGDNPTYYSLLRLALWLLSGWLLFRTFKPILGERSVWVSLLLFSFPVFTSAQLFNCFQTGYLLALLFWAASLKVLFGKIFRNEMARIALSTILLGLSLLSCELLFPLFFLNITLPSIAQRRMDSEGAGKVSVKAFLINALPVAMLMLAYVIFKFAVSSFAEDGPYGLALNVASVFQALYFFASITLGVLMLLLETIPHLISSPWAWSALLVLPLHYFLRKTAVANTERNDVKPILKVLLITLFLCVFVFLLSGYPAVTYGNYNKMMLPAFVVFCLLFGHLLSMALNGKFWPLVLPVVFLWVFSMNVQVDNFIRSWEFRTAVLSDLSQKLNSTDMGADAVVVANVPYFTPNDLNSEHVFWLHWDFTAGAKLYGLGKQVELYPFCHRTLMDSEVYPLHNVNTFLEQRKPENIWVYEMDGETVRAKLFQVRSFERYKAQRALEPLNDHQLTPRALLRQKIKVLVKKTADQ